MSDYIEIGGLERRSADGIVRTFFDEHLREQATSVKIMIRDIKKVYKFVIGRSNLHKILMLMLEDNYIDRKKVGNTFYYHRKAFESQG